MKNLTIREKEILEYMVKGFTNTQIAKNLNITVHTVKAHISSMYNKTKTTNRVTLVVKYIAKGNKN